MKKRAFAINFVIFGATAGAAILLGGQLPYLIKQWHGPFKEADYSMHVAQQPNNLTLYGTTTCPHCISAREYLREKGIPFNDMIIDKSDTASIAFRQLEEKAVPVLVSVNRLVVGFDRNAYAELNQIVNKK
jgi:glutaredoxin 3